MNQILSTENNYKQKKTKSDAVLDMRKIIIVFSLLIIAFALVIVIAKIYGMVREKNKNDVTEVLNKPTIEINKVAQNACTIVVSYDEGLSKVSYRWNDDTTIIENNQNGSSPYVTTITIPDGEENKLYVKAIGMDGSINEIYKDFRIEEPIEGPEILWQKNGATMDIIARSENGIKNLSYNWEGEEPIVQEATEENQKELKITIDVKRGNNKLYTVATDVNGKETIKADYLIGVLSPEIDYIIINRTLNIKIKHDMGFKKIIIKLNNQEFIYDENNPEYSMETTELNVSTDLEPGEIEVDISVFTMEQPNEEYRQQGYAEIPG